MTELPKGWVETTLGCVAEWGSGGTPKATDRDYYGGGIPWAVIGDLNDATVASTAATISDAGLTNSSAKLVEPGTVLVAMYGSIGKLGIAGQRMATNQAIAFANGRVGLADNRFLFWFLRWQRSALATAGKGATQKNISQTVLKAWPIRLPPLPEQERIVAAIEEQLSRIDAGESALREAARGTSALAEAAVRAAEHGESSPLADLLVEPLANGRSVPTAISGFPVLRLTALREGRIDLHKRKTGAWEKEDAERFLVKRGDFFISRGNGSIALVGRGGLVEVQPDDVAFPDTMIRARVDSSRIDPRFLRVVWNGPRTRRQIERAARTTAGIYKVNQKDLERVILPVPPIAVQNEIVAANEHHTSVVDALRTAISHALVRSGHLRRAVLERALSGRLVPQVWNDEPAPELLDRIAAERVDTLKSRPRKRA